MKVLVWATTLQADILALAYCLDRSQHCELMLVTRHAAALATEPIHTVRPFSVPIWDRDSNGIEERVLAFGPDVVVADNHLPTFLRNTRLFLMWHGLGWKARGRADLAVFYKNVKRLTGADPRTASPWFRAQCYGATDRAWRIREWQLPESSCVTIGSCFSDLLLNPPYTRAALQKHYDIDISAKKVVLLSISWHYGRILADHRDGGGLLAPRTGLESDIRLLREVLTGITESGACCLLCLHDKTRYAPDYLDAITAVARRFENVMIKHKSDHPDNLADLLVADVMVSNLSSFISYFYYLGRPSVHILPVAPNAAAVRLARLKGGRVAYRKLGTTERLWMNDPSDNGGLSARTPGEIMGAIRRGLSDPDCCKERSLAWLARHVHQPNGHTAERFLDAIRAFVEQG